MSVEISRTHTYTSRFQVGYGVLYIKCIFACVILTCAWLFIVKGASAAPLDLDPDFGVHGHIIFSTGQPQSVGVNSAAQPDGKLIVTGSRQKVVENQYSAEMFARRFNVDGSPDTGFGINGESRFSVRGFDDIHMITLQADGKILLAVGAREPCVPYTIPTPGCATSSGQKSVYISAIVRLQKDGTLDTTLGGKGFVEATDFHGGDRVAVQPDGKLLLLGAISVPRLPVSEWVANWKLARFNADGTRDVSFNGGDAVSSRCNTLGSALLIQKDGSILVGGSSNSPENRGICIERLFPDGDHDLSFNQGKIYTDFGQDASFHSLEELKDGKILAAGRYISRYEGDQSARQIGVFAARFAADGILDPDYGNNGTFLYPVAEYYWHVGSTFARDGAIIAAGFEYIAGEQQQQYRTTLVKVTPDGHADPRFGNNGILRSSSISAAYDYPRGFLSDSTYHWFMISEKTLSDLNVGVLIERYKGENMDGLPVVEFYNTSLDHYFITADAAEAATIDNGSAGPGWKRTGYGFMSGGSTSVCRFYGSMSPGPNSHFYTLAGSECDSLKQQQADTPSTEKRWNFESMDFASTQPVTGGINGSCSANTIPVYRAYNNGFSRGIDSNHRISTSQEAIQEVVYRGWINEGVVMCAPN